jgi:hypothetical protein
MPCIDEPVEFPTMANRSVRRRPARQPRLLPGASSLLALVMYDTSATHPKGGTTFFVELPRWTGGDFYLHSVEVMMRHVLLPSRLL